VLSTGVELEFEEIALLEERPGLTNKQTTGVLRSERGRVAKKFKRVESRGFYDGF
jgi:hypothetical protein